MCSSIASAASALVFLLSLAAPAAAQEILGLRLGKDRLQDALSRVGLTPLAPPGEELCYAAETPFESTWVVFGTSAAGNWEVLTRFRVLSSAPPGMICSRTPLITAALLRPMAPVKGYAARTQTRNGRVVAFEMTLEEKE